MRAIFEKVDDQSKTLTFVHNIYDLTIKKLITLRVLNMEVDEVYPEMFKNACLDKKINVQDFIDHLS